MYRLAAEIEVQDAMTSHQHSKKYADELWIWSKHTPADLRQEHRARQKNHHRQQDATLKRKKAMEVLELARSGVREGDDPPDEDWNPSLPRSGIVRKATRHKAVVGEPSCEEGEQADDDCDPTYVPPGDVEPTEQATTTRSGMEYCISQRILVAMTRYSHDSTHRS